ELNPMFEGHFQHDAQELLRCLLCYIEDAEKELTQLRDKEGANGEDVERISEAVLDIEEDEKIDTGMTEKRTLSHTFCTSLKGGESQDRSKITESDSHRQQVLVTNVLKCERNSAMILSDKNSTINNRNDVIDDHATSLKLEAEEVETSFSGLSFCQTTKGRKRKRSKSKSAASNRVAGASKDVATTSTVRTRGLRRKTAGSDSHLCFMSLGTHEETQSGLTGSAGQRHIENLAVDCHSDSHCHQKLQTEATVSQNCKMSPGPSTKASTAVKCEDGSTSSRILPFQPLNQIKKRLGVRGRAIISSICQAGEQFIKGDNHVGDVNNNSDSCNSNSSRSLGVAVDNILEASHSHHQAVSPSSKDKMSPCKMVLKSPAKSPVVVEHTDEISMIPEGETSHMNSPINTATKKYITSGSRSSMATSLQLPSLTSQPAATRTETGLVAEPHGDILPLHVLEPNKEINVTVQVSPKKKSSLLELNQKPGLCVPLDRASSERLALSPENATKCPVPLADTYPSGVQSDKDGDSALYTRLNVNDESAHESRSQFPEALQTSDNLAAPCTTKTSTCGILPRLVTCAKTYSLCNPQDKENLHKQAHKSPQISSCCPGVQDTTAQRSPGANVPDHTRTLQPKLELRKCDWLGVSPVKSVSAIEAMSVLCQKRMGLESFTARRKILYDDTDSSLHSSNISSDVKCLPTDNIRDHISLTDCRESVPAENESKQRHSKVCSVAPARKSVRTSKSTKFRKLISCSSNKLLKTCQPPSAGQDICLKSLSVTLDRCDWLLQTSPGLSVSAKQALVDMRKGCRITSHHQKSQMADMLKQCQVQKTDLSISGIKPGTLVESLFGGTMVHQTKCLECEVARHRQEVFMDIGVPVRSLHTDNSDDDSDDDCSSNTTDKSGSSCLSKLMQACTSVERLNDANKYFCEQCVHHVEAERSCHYLTLPSVLTLHLKRFSTNSKLFGHVSKLTDKVAIPQTLPCLLYQCKGQCFNSSHTFSLFAIVTHSGSSILHGHYRAYVKVQPHVNPSVFCKLLKSKMKMENSQLVETKMDTSSDPDSFKDESDWTSEQRSFVSASDSLCNDSKCCEYDDVYLCDQTLNVSTSTRPLVNKSRCLRNDIDNVRTTQLKSHSHERKFDGGATDHMTSESWLGSSKHGSFWLECDDECIKVMEEREFIDKLEEKDGSLIGTPYVLFYHKQLQ
ncbi:unnamed protein product, partial [Candidula unifasciata]